jgi:hypothetical protein
MYVCVCLCEKSHSLQKKSRRVETIPWPKVHVISRGFPASSIIVASFIGNRTAESIQFLFCSFA